MKLDEVEITNADESARFESRLNRYFQKEKPKALKIVVSERTKSSTIQQARALFGHAYKILRNETGADVNDLHRHFCGEYFGWIEVEIDGRNYERPLRTTTTNEEGYPERISTRDFASLFEFVQQRAAQGNPAVIIPDPDKDWKKKLNAQIQREEIPCSS